MMKFQVLPQSALSEQSFDEFPIWSEHYDFEELEDIERWGLDRDVVLAMFRENELGSQHCVYTLLESNPFPARMRIFIKASLETQGGILMKGYVMNEDAFCLTVFSKGDQFHFSRHPSLEHINRESERALAQSTGISESELFPLKYGTDFKDSSGEVIAGIFEFGKMISGDLV
jgi:hypothetical protein